MTTWVFDRHIISNTQAGLKLMLTEAKKKISLELSNYIHIYYANLIVDFAH